MVLGLGKLLCRKGFHRWKKVQDLSVGDVMRKRTYICRRCGADHTVHENWRR